MIRCHLMKSLSQILNLWSQQNQMSLSHSFDQVGNALHRRREQSDSWSRSRRKSSPCASSYSCCLYQSCCQSCLRNCLNFHCCHWSYHDQYHCHYLRNLFRYCRVPHRYHLRRSYLFHYDSPCHQSQRSYRLSSCFHHQSRLSCSWMMSLTHLSQRINRYRHHFGYHYYHCHYYLTCLNRYHLRTNQNQWN